MKTKEIKRRKKIALLLGGYIFFHIDIFDMQVVLSLLFFYKVVQFRYLNNNTRKVIIFNIFNLLIFLKNATLFINLYYLHVIFVGVYCRILISWLLQFSRKNQQQCRPREYLLVLQWNLYSKHFTIQIRCNKTDRTINILKLPMYLWDRPLSQCDLTITCLRYSRTHFQFYAHHYFK